MDCLGREKRRQNTHKTLRGIAEMTTSQRSACVPVRLTTKELLPNRQSERLLRITAAIADAVKREEVFEAVVDEVGAALGALTAALWMLRGETSTLDLARAHGDEDASRHRYEHLSLDGPPLPPTDAIRRSAPLWISSQEQLLAEYPHLAGTVTPGATYRIACLPVVTARKTVGVLVFTFDTTGSWGSDDDRSLLLLVVRYAGQALELLLLLEAEKVSRANTLRLNEMLTGMLGHDLRNPLAAIITSTRLAQMRTEDERVGKPLSRIISSSARMGRMIDQLLDFTRVRLGAGMTLRRDRVALTPLVRQVMDELDDAHPAWTLRLEEHGDTHGTWDGDRLAQVFSNLVANGLQHGSAEGGLTVTIDGAAADRVRVEVRNRGAIPDDLLPAIFEPLAGRSRRLAGSRGLGLGLFITNEIVRAHGGGIVVTSRDGDTSFAVTLPREQGAELR
jgi:signal transduction histidine kinase